MEQLFITKCKNFISFMLSQQQWSGLTQENIDLWLKNFEELSAEELVLVYKLLTNILYFSENDVIDSLRKGIFQCLSYNDVLTKQITTGFSTSQHALETIHQSNINQVCIVPLLDQGAPFESSNNICRLLVQQGIVPQKSITSIENVPELLKKYKIDKFVIVDDCVGTGEQLRTFWNRTCVDDDGEKLSIKSLCEKYNLTAFYLTLFGYENSIIQLKDEIESLSIICVQILKDQHRVFDDNSYIWENMEERDQAYKLLLSLTKNVAIPILGFQELDFAFIMHKTIPDWSLPLFWKTNSEWNFLLGRKNSNV